MQRLYDKLQTFSDHFFARQTLFAGYSRQEVNILQTITVNSAFRRIFTRYWREDGFSVREYHDSLTRGVEIVKFSTCPGTSKKLKCTCP